MLALVLPLSLIRRIAATLTLAGNIPGRTTTVPLAIYTAVQTGESGEAFVLVALLTMVSCAVIWLATRNSSAAR